jgi:hypothetical protein
MDGLIEAMAIYGSPLALVLFGMAMYFEWQDYRAGKKKAQEKALRKARKKEKNA